MDIIKHTEETINRISFQEPNYRPYIILTFEPSEELIQVIKDNHCTYCVIPKSFVPRAFKINRVENNAIKIFKNIFEYNIPVFKIILEEFCIINSSRFLFALKQFL